MTALTDKKFRRLVRNLNTITFLFETEIGGYREEGGSGNVAVVREEICDEE